MNIGMITSNESNNGLLHKTRHNGERNTRGLQNASSRLNLLSQISVDKDTFNLKLSEEAIKKFEESKEINAGELKTEVEASFVENEERLKDPFADLNKALEGKDINNLSEEERKELLNLAAEALYQNFDRTNDEMFLKTGKWVRTDEQMQALYEKKMQEIDEDASLSDEEKTFMKDLITGGFVETYTNLRHSTESGTNFATLEAMSISYGKGRDADRDFYYAKDKALEQMSKFSDRINNTELRTKFADVLAKQLLEVKDKDPWFAKTWSEEHYLKGADRETWEALRLHEYNEKYRESGQLDKDYNSALKELYEMINK